MRARHHATRMLPTLAVLFYAACTDPAYPRAVLFLVPAAGRPPPSSSAATALGDIEVLIDVHQLERNVISLDLGSRFEARLVERVRRGPGDFTWYGRIAPHGVVMLDVKDGAVTGIVETDDARYLLMSPSSGRHVLVPRRRSPAAFKHPDNFKNVKANPGTATACSSAETSTMIELLVAHTPGAAAGARAGGRDIERVVENAVRLANEANRASKLELTFHLAHEYQTTDGERSDMDETLDAFQDTDDDYFKEVHGLRDTHKADICVIVFRGNGSFGGTTHAIMATDPEAFAIVDHRFLEDDVLAHEIGHLMALHHTNDTSNEPCTEGHGYRHDNGQTDTWGTIMTDDCEHGCQMIRLWSNPDVQYHGSDTGKSGSSNSARVLNATARSVSRFRPR